MVMLTTTPPSSSATTTTGANMKRNSSSSIVLLHNGQKAKFKDDIMKLCGGDTFFEFLVLSYCERIQEDEDLDYFFGNFDLKSLISLQKTLLFAAFIEEPTKNDDDNIHINKEYLHGRVTLLFHRLFEMGLNDIHFDMMRKHFLGALLDCWSGKNLVQICNKHLEELRYIFQENGKEMIQLKKKQKAVEDQLSESMRRNHQDFSSSYYYQAWPNADVPDARRGDRQMPPEMCLNWTDVVPAVVLYFPLNVLLAPEPRRTMGR